MSKESRAFVEAYLSKSLAAMQAFADDRVLHGSVIAMADVVTAAFSARRKLLIAGNGGSAGDAQHMAGEFISRLFFDHAPLPAFALTTDTSVLTATGNDYGFEKVFERQVQGLGFPGDVFLGISTSGKSRNVLAALEAARTQGLKTLGFTGTRQGPMDELCEVVLHAPSSETAVIQQIHIAAVHLICGLVEERMFAKAGTTEGA